MLWCADCAATERQRVLLSEPEVEDVVLERCARPAIVTTEQARKWEKAYATRASVHPRDKALRTRRAARWLAAPHGSHPRLVFDCEHPTDNAL
jgi:hypothetical protein